MGALKLYTYSGNKNAFKALIAAQYVGAKIECPAFQMGVDNKSPEFLKKNPHGKVPVLETEHGCVFESNAIARYVARLADVGLFGSTTIDLGKVEQWIDFSTNEIDAPMSSWVYPLLGFWPYDAKKEKAAIEAVKKALTALNTFLETRTYLVGDHVTLADIICVCNLFHGFTKVYDKGFRSAFPNVERYFLTCAHKPQFAAVFGDVKLCETPLAPPKEDKKAAAKDEKKPKEEKPKAAPKPAAAAAPKEAPAAAEEEKPKEKPKDPMADLPPTPMQMDSWKRLYSNSPASNFREVCIKRLWEGGPVPNSPSNEEFVGYDPQGYSWWFFDYKYPEENTVNYIVMNKVGGFIQRVDYARKYAFGVMAILKKGDQFPIKGAWMFRGQEIPKQLVDECYDLELYNIRKADLSNAVDKKLIEDIICEESTIDGMECVDCKVFK